MTTPNITRLKLPAIRRAIAATQWAIQREKLMAALEVIEIRSVGGHFTPDQIQARTGNARAGDKKPVTKQGGGTIAVLPLYGVIAQRMDMFMYYSGGTSTERFSDDFDAAMADDNVSAIVIDCDSPGGSVQGTPELAKRILDARGKGKKIIAVSNGTMASAAYWICSAADEVVCTPSGEVGSVGVFCVHLDESGYNEQLGLNYSLISAGAYKVECNPYEPLTDEARAHLQQGVDEMYDMFVSAVAKQRGISTKVVEKDYGQGRVLSAAQAKTAGMIDRIATLEDTLKRLGATDIGLSGRPRAATADPNGRAKGAALPTVLRADGEVEPDEPANEPDDTDDDLCPECGGAMQDDQCESCGYQRASTNSDTEAGASASSEPTSPDNHRPDEAREHTVQNGNSTTAAGGAVDVNAAVQAERKRIGDIRALGAKHRVTAEVIDACVTEGLSVEQSAVRVLSSVEARGAASPDIRVGADREADQNFGSAGEQLVSIIRATRGGRLDARLRRVNANALRLDRDGAQEMMAGTPSGMSEGVASEGGFFLAPEVLPGVVEPVYADDPILSRVHRIPIGNGTNRTVYNVVDEASRVDGSRWGAMKMYWGDEADAAATAAKIKMRQVEQLLKKLIGIGYLTDEQLEDTPQAQTLLTDAFQAETRFMLTSAIFRGPGGGQPLGFLKGKGGVQQAIEAAQTIANSPASLALNTTKMKSNIPAPLWSDLIWLYNQELLPYLMVATVGGTTIPVFVPAAGFGEMGSVDRILGAPAFPSEQCEAVGTPGDIVCIAPSQYHVGEKGGAYIATSVHVRFLNDETALRITYRVDGKPVWNTTVAPYKGANQRGFFSTLAARA